MFFEPIAEAAVVLRANGVLTETAIYIWGVDIYAKKGTGFVRLSKGHCTSHMKTTWVAMVTPPDMEISYDTHGRMYMGPEKPTKRRK